MLLTDLADLGATAATTSIIWSYLQGRTASLISGGVRKEIKLTLGCPQGSILGPSLWNVTTEALLKQVFPEVVNVQAYAGDIAISVAANTSARLIHLAEVTLAPVLDWGNARGLTFSTAKFEALITKGNLEPGFTIPFGDNRTRTVTSVRYLGVHLDQYWNFQSHIESLPNKNVELFSRLRSTLGHYWGIQRTNLLVIYKSVFLSSVAYGACIWSHAITSESHRKTLYSLQRHALLAITSAYRTTSTEALQVIAGTLPLDLEISLIAAKRRAKSLPTVQSIMAIAQAREECLTTWQNRWANSQKGRWTHAFSQTSE